MLQRLKELPEVRECGALIVPVPELSGAAYVRRRLGSGGEESKQARLVLIARAFHVSAFQALKVLLDARDHRVLLNRLPYKGLKHAGIGAVR